MITLNFFLFLIFLSEYFTLSKNQIDAIVLLLSITKHSIWTHRNQLVQEGIAFDSDCMIKKIVNTIISRYRVEKYR